MKKLIVFLSIVSILFLSGCTPVESKGESEATALSVSQTETVETAKQPKASNTYYTDSSERQYILMKLFEGLDADDYEGKNKRVEQYYEEHPEYESLTGGFTLDKECDASCSRVWKSDDGKVEFRLNAVLGPLCNEMMSFDGTYTIDGKKLNVIVYPGYGHMHIEFGSTPPYYKKGQGENYWTGYVLVGDSVYDQNKQELTVTVGEFENTIPEDSVFYDIPVYHKGDVVTFKMQK